MSFPKYPAYKDSGVQWLGEVPEHWTTTSLKYFAELNPKKSDYRGDQGQLCSFIPMEKLKTGAIQLDEVRTIADVITGYTYFEDGDVLQAKVTPCFENGNIAIADGLTNGVGFGSSEINVLRPFKIDVGFLYYRLQEDAFMSICTASMIGAGGLKRVPGEVINGFTVAIPDRNEQTQIARFLDHETARIDALIEEQQRLIELLKEKRQAVISHAVTKGLDPTVPMKDSGVEWLGEVPAHWDVKKLGFLGEAIIGLTYSPDDVVSEGVLVLRSSNVQDGRLSFANNVFVRKVIPEKLMVKKGDILICSRNGSRDLIGKNALISESEDGMTFGAFMTIFRSPINDFLHQVFNSSIFSAQSGSFMTSTVNQLTTGNLNSFLIPVPPRSEQLIIAKRLLSFRSRFEVLISEALTSMALLQERRSALISAAVTGKIDVRGWQPPANASSPALK